MQNKSRLFTQQKNIKFKNFRKSKIYACNIYILNMCGKFEVNWFRILKKILHAVFEDMLSIKKKTHLKIYA